MSVLTSKGDKTLKRAHAMGAARVDVVVMVGDDVVAMTTGHLSCPRSDLVEVGPDPLGGLAVCHRGTWEPVHRKLE